MSVSGRVLNYFSKDPFGLFLTLAAPATVLWFYPSLYNAIGWIDAWIYTGHIRNFDDVVERIGPTYYGARIAHIFPAAWLEQMLGQKAGAYAFRYLLLLGGSLGAYVMARRLYSPPVGVVAAVFFVAAPWMPYSLVSDHYDGTATAYLMVAYALAFTPTKRVLAWLAAAAVAAGLAAHVNQLAVGVLATAAPAWLYLNWQLGWKRIAAGAAVGAAAFTATYLALEGVLLLSNARWWEGNPTLAMMVQLLRGGASAWASSINDVATVELYYGLAGLVPALVLLLSLRRIGAARRRADRSNPGWPLAAAFLALLPVLFYLQRQSANHGVLFYSHTLLFLFPSITIGLFTVVGETVRMLNPRAGAAFCWSLAVAALATWIAGTPQNYSYIDASLDFWSAAAVGSAIAVTLAASLALGRPVAAAVSTFVMVLFVAVLPIQTDQYARMKAPIAAGIDGFDYRGGALHLVDVVHANIPTKGTHVGFWYPSGWVFDSIQSTYGWGMTRAFPFDVPGLPVLDQKSGESMLAFDPIVLLANTEEELDAGIESLTAFLDAKSMRPETRHRSRYDSDTFDFSYAIVWRGKTQP